MKNRHLRLPSLISLAVICKLVTKTEKRKQQNNLHFDLIVKSSLRLSPSAIFRTFQRNALLTFEHVLCRIYRRVTNLQSPYHRIATRAHLQLILALKLSHAAIVPYTAALLTVYIFCMYVYHLWTENRSILRTLSFSIHHVGLNVCVYYLFIPGGWEIFFSKTYVREQYE